MTFSRRQICSTKNLPLQNEYTKALNGELSKWAFDEERAPLNKGNWREQVFNASSLMPMDLEIGTGNGLHFAHRTHQYPQRLILGIEIKYKPLIQTIRRALRVGSKNGAVIRYHAFNVAELFEKDEIDDVFIHFPDPWVSPRKPKNRLVQKELLRQLSILQKKGSYLEFKTDSRESFDWSLEEIKDSPYKIVRCSFDFHKEPDIAEALKNRKYLTTAFENIFIREGLPTHYVLLQNTQEKLPIT